MGRPSKNSEKSQVLYARDAFNIFQAVMLLWLRDCVGGITGKSGIGGIDFAGGNIARNGIEYSLGSLGIEDTESDSEEWFLNVSTSLTNPDADGSLSKKLTAEVNVTKEEAIRDLNHLITLKRAADWLRREFSRVQIKMALQQAKAEVKGTTGRFRRWVHYGRSHGVAKTYLHIGIERMREVCLTQRRRVRGPQLVQTQKPLDGIPYYTSFEFSGTHAMKLPQGHPSLSEAEWIRRHKARNAKRNKTGRHLAKDKRTLKVPQPKHGRPSQMLWAKLREFDKTKSGPTFAKADFNDSQILQDLESGEV